MPGRIRSSVADATADLPTSGRAENAHHPGVDALQEIREPVRARNCSVSTAPYSADSDTVVTYDYP